MPSDARKQADEALARYGRIEAVLEAQRQLTPAERALLPHAMFDENDLVVLQSALRCERALGAGPSQFTATFGLAPRTRVVFVPRAANPHEPPGSMPAALMTPAAAGEVRNLNNVLAASGSLALVTIPAETTLIDCNSAGNGPSRSAPCTCTISLISWMPSSASPRATISALGVVAARAFRIDLALISWAMPRRSSTFS